MAFRVAKSANFKRLKKLTPSQRMDYIKRTPDYGASLLSSLTPAQFAELFPDYYRRSLPDVSGFREAISRRSTQKQDDINFGLTQGAKTIEEAERMGSWRRRGGGGDSKGVSSTTAGGAGVYSGSVKGWWTPDRQKHAVEYLMQHGKFTQYGAAAAVARMTREASGGPTSVNPSSGAFGIAQWLGSRKTGIAGNTDFDAQLSHYVKESWTNEKAAGDRFRSATNAQQGAYAAASFERAEGWKESGGKTDILMNRTPVDTVYNNAFGSGAPGGETTASTMSKKSSKSGGFYGGGQECADLSKHFGNLGAASGWKFKEGSAIVPGSIIATTSYGKGDHPGGRHAGDMPDKKSHYHTGVALTAPDSKGNVLILEQFKGQPAQVAMVNINNYRGSGERMAVLEGGEPTARSMQAVEIGRGLANPDQLAWMSTGSAEPRTTSAGSPAQVNPVKEAPTPAASPTFKSTEQTQAYPGDQQQTGPKDAVKFEKVDKSKKSSETYKFDPDKYWNEVKTKRPAADSFLYGKDKVMQETYKGFEDAQAAGAIKWNRKTNEIQILDPNHEKIQQIYKDMRDNYIDRNAFLSKTEAGGAGSAKVSRSKRHGAARVAVDTYSPEVTSSGLNKDSRLVDYTSERAASAIGVSPEKYNAFREAAASIESSGGKYDLRGGSSKRFSGAYQIGGAELKEVAERLGEEAPVMRVKGRKTPVANEQFLNDPHMQERYFEEYNLMHHERLMKNKRYAAMSPDDRMGILGMAHNKGAGAARHYLNTGRIGTDAAGTHPQKYASRINKQLAGLKTASDSMTAAAPSTTPVAAASPATPTAKIGPRFLGEKAKSLDIYSGAIQAAPDLAAPVSQTPKTTSTPTTPKTTSTPTTPQTTPILRQQPDTGKMHQDAIPPEVERKTMEPEAPKDNQQFNMQQTSTDRVQSINIDKLAERKNPEFSSPSLERHAFTIRQQQPTTGANFMHMGSDSA